jgi:hypothetical protein
MRIASGNDSPDKGARRGALILVAVVAAIVAVLGFAWAVLTVWTQLTG